MLLNLNSGVWTSNSNIITMESYVVISFIGEGSFGRVFKAKHKETDAIVALKVIRKVCILY